MSIAPGSISPKTHIDPRTDYNNGSAYRSIEKQQQIYSALVISLIVYAHFQKLQFGASLFQSGLILIIFYLIYGIADARAFMNEIDRTVNRKPR